MITASEKREDKCLLIVNLIIFCVHRIVTPINKIAGQYLKCESGLRRQLVAVFKSAIVKPTSFICKKKREGKK